MPVGRDSVRICGMWRDSRRGNLEVLKGLRAGGCPLAAQAGQYEADGGLLEVLKRLQAKLWED